MSQEEPSYQEQIAQWRQQRAHEQIASRVEEIKTEYQEAVTERDKLVAEGQIDEAAYWDDTVQRLDCEYQQYVPPPQPQAHPKVVGLARRNAPYFRKYGQSGIAAADWSHNKTLAAGITPDSPKYGEMVRSFMEMYAKDFGAPYDPNSQLLTANEAAKISGLSPDAYNRASQTLAAQGRFTRNRK
jgi:hypothetical protein